MRTTASALLVLALAGCSSQTASLAAADGILDCADGLISRRAGIETSGPTEQEAVDKALSSWVTEGAQLVELPSGESWAAVDDGQEVAIALTEIEGDGGWVVYDVQTCGEPDVGPAPIDWDLDCANDYAWGFQGDFEAGAVGEPTAEAAVRLALGRYMDAFGGEIVLVDDRTGSLVVDQREQVVVFVADIPDGTGWGVSTVAGCEGYDLVSP